MRAVSAAEDARFMAAAVAMAWRGIGIVWPNPAVGAVIVQRDEKGPRIVGRGTTSMPGGPHAEINALRQAGAQAEGATAYVTLEPCSHYGRTPPCSLALIKAGIRRVVIGTLDPNPRVAGRGVAMLKDGGVEVVSGCYEPACLEVHAGHSLRLLERRPHVTLKMAVSSDGYIGRVHADGARKPVAITGDLARRMVHGMRARSDAIMVGIGTVLADNPDLTCRLPGMECLSPVRVVLDAHARLPLDSRLVATAADVPVWALVGWDADPDRLEALKKAGVLLIRVPAIDHVVTPDTALAALSTRGITRVLLEGGAHVAAGFLDAGLVDDAMILRGNTEIGSDGILPFAGDPLDVLTSSDKFKSIEAGLWGEDRFTLYRYCKET